MLHLIKELSFHFICAVISTELENKAEALRYVTASRQSWCLQHWSRDSDLLRAGRFGVWTCVWWTFSTPDHTGSAQPASYTMGTVSLAG